MIVCDSGEIVQLPRFDRRFSGASICTGGDVEQSEADDVLKLINDRRKALVDGTQKNGGSGKMLPPAKGMTAISWSCELEKDTKEGLKNHSCDQDFPPQDPKGRARLYTSDYENYADPDISTFIKTNLDFVDTIGLQDVTDTSVKYKEEGLTYLYSQAVRATTTEIGCSLKKCDIGGFKMFAAYCLTNQPTLQVGQVIYEVGKAGECLDCPQGTTCDPNTKLCVAAATTTTTTTAPKTTTGPATTTAIPPAPGAGFPTGASNKCPNNKMTDALRDQFLSLHNFRRSLLAKGEVAKNTGNLLPKASNMVKMQYDCTLEQGAIEWAGQCGNVGSPESSRQGVGENFKRFPGGNFPTFGDAAKKSVTEWWKVVRKVPGIGMAATFRQHHVGTPIESFTQMGWALTTKLGCSIVKCSSDYVGVCRYSPKGNIVEQSVYKVGNVCSACPAGVKECVASEALCVM
ncbi:SCP-like protein [Ancylostoma caninum]|uniref:SCP-like protein n=1 Tax=Ancylostoma caninum TaxID=29170 RepID=A0A368GAL6_ANCCA|nr:SCP-like protein [Ancylostoma caninum]